MMQPEATKVDQKYASNKFYETDADHFIIGRFDCLQVLKVYQLEKKQQFQLYTIKIK